MALSHVLLLLVAVAAVMAVAVHAQPSSSSSPSPPVLAMIRRARLAAADAQLRVEIAEAAAEAATLAAANVTGPVDAALAGFDKNTARRFLHYAYAAMCPEAQLKAWNCKWCKDKGEFVSSLYDARTDTYGYVVYDRTHNAVVVSFRGSKSLINWIQDIKFWKATQPFDGVSGAMIAQGFYECFTGVGAQVQRTVRAALNAHPGASLYLVGHSLGGALATLASFDLNQVAGVRATEVYTFGSPRVGSSGFAAAYKARVPVTWRMTNHHDIVPHLPLKAMDFQHVATEVWENGDTYKVCNASGEDPTCINSQPADGTADHSMYMQEHAGC